MRYLILLFAILSIPALAFSATIIVPDDYPTIQGAIDAASNGDTVLVAPGTYMERINFNGKAITLRSEYGPERTMIDADYLGITVIFSNGEGPDSLLEGFTITRGSDLNAGGIPGEASDVTMPIPPLSIISSP